MAKFYFGPGHNPDFTMSPNVPGEWTVWSTSLLRFERGPLDFEYGGRFPMNANDQIIGGNLTRYTVKLNDEIALSMEDFSVSAVLAFDHLAQNDFAGFEALIFAGADEFSGSRFGDVLSAYSGADLMRGFGGDDKMHGGNGNDTVDGGVGNDLLVGANGRDKLLGGAGRDELYGDNGRDDLRGGTGKDQLFGGNGNDRLNGGGGIDQMEGGNGSDLYIVDRSGDKIVEKQQNVTDKVRAYKSFKLPDLVENLTLMGAEDINGTGNGLANRLTGNRGDNHLTGKNGADLLNGKKGDDDLDGGRDADKLRGGSGNDRLLGGAGNDVLDGGVGDDTFVILQGTDRDTILDFLDGADLLDVSDFGFGDAGDVLALASQKGANTHIQLSDNDLVVLRQTSVDDLDEIHFIV